MRALAAQKRQRCGQQHRYPGANGKGHDGGEASAGSQASPAQLGAARQLVQEVQHAQQAHHISRVPVKPDGARRRGEQPGACVALHKAPHAQQRARRHDHAVKPHDVAGIAQNVRRKRIGAGKQHQRPLARRRRRRGQGARLTPGGRLGGQKAPAQKVQARRRAGGYLQQRQPREQLRHGFGRVKPCQQIKGARQIIGEQAEHAATKAGGVAVQQVTFPVHHLDEPSEVIGVLHRHVVHHHRHVAERVDAQQRERGNQYAERDGKGGGVAYGRRRPRTERGTSGLVGVAGDVHRRKGSFRVAALRGAAVDITWSQVGEQPQAGGYHIRLFRALPAPRRPTC